jgi:hypothetical protein
LLFTLFGIDQLAAAAIPGFAETPWLTNVVIGTLVAFAWLRVTLRENSAFGPRPHTVQLLLICYAGYFIYSVFAWSPHEPTVNEMTIRLLYLGLCIVAGPALLRSAADAEGALQVALAAGTSILTVVVLNPDWRPVDARLTLAAVGSSTSDATLMNPLALADVAVVTVAAGLFTTGRGRALGWVGVAVGVWAASQASRGEPLAAFAAVLVILFWSRGRGRGPRRMALALALLAVGATAAYWISESPVALRWQSETLERSLTERVELSVGLWRAYLDRPGSWVFGLGGDYSRADDLLGVYPHLQVLQALCETGLIGLGLWLAIAVLTLGRLARLSSATTPNEGASRQALLALALYHFILTFKRGHVLDPEWFLYAVCVERIMAFSASADVRPTANRRTRLGAARWPYRERTGGPGPRRRE